MGNFCRKDHQSYLLDDIQQQQPSQGVSKFYDLFKPDRELANQRRMYKSEDPRLKINSDAKVNQGRLQQKIQQVYEELDGVKKKSASKKDTDDTVTETQCAMISENNQKQLNLPSRGGLLPAPAMVKPLLSKVQRREGTFSITSAQRFIFPAPGTLGMKHNLRTHVNNTIVTVYCPMTFEIFQVRTNNCMTITDFKRKIASKYETTLDNIIISYAEKEFKGRQSQQSSSLISKVMFSTNQPQDNDESRLLLRYILSLDSKSIIKVTFKVKPQGLNIKSVQAQIIQKKKKIRIHQPVEGVISAQLFPQKQKVNMSHPRHQFKHQTSTENLVITTEETEKLYNCDLSYSKIETQVNNDTGIMQQYFNYQEQMNTKFPQKKKRQILSPPPAVDQLFNRAANKQFYQTQNNNPKSEAWKQALQRLNEETVRVATISHIESQAHKTINSSFGSEKNQYKFGNRRLTTMVGATKTAFEQEFTQFQRKKPDITLQTLEEGVEKLKNTSFLNRLSVDARTNQDSQIQGIPQNLLTTTVVLLQNNLKSFDKSHGVREGGSLSGTLNRQSLTKSPGLGGTLEVKQIGNTTSNTFMNNNCLQGSSIGGGGASFMKKTFVGDRTFVNLNKIDTINEIHNESNQNAVDQKQNLIIVNKNEHFKVSKKEGKEMSADSQKVRKSKIVSSSQALNLTNNQGDRTAAMSSIFMNKRTSHQQISLQKPHYQEVMSRLLSPTQAISEQQHLSLVAGPKIMMNQNSRGFRQQRKMAEILEAQQQNPPKTAVSNIMINNRNKPGPVQ